MASRPFPVDAVRTSIAIGYQNDRLSFIADDILPRVPVGGEMFSWLYLPAGQAFTVPQTHVGRRGRVERVEFEGKKQTSETEDYGLEDSIPQTDIDAAAAMRANGLGTYDPLDVATEMLTNLVLIDREVRVASLIQDPANYAPGNHLALAGSSQFSDKSSSVIDTLKAGFNSTLVFRPNTCTMSRSVWGVINSHPEIVNAVKGNVSSKGIITPDEFVALFSGDGLKKLCIGEAFVNTARKGQTPVLDRVWGNSISLTYIDPSARPEFSATFGMTAQFGSRLAYNFPDPHVGLKGGTIMRVGEQVKEIITAPEAGYLLTNVIASMPAGVAIAPGR